MALPGAEHRQINYVLCGKQYLLEKSIMVHFQQPF
jgi:hypothetical protein